MHVGGENPLLDGRENPLLQGAAAFRARQREDRHNSGQ